MEIFKEALNIILSEEAAKKKKIIDPITGKKSIRWTCGKGKRVDKSEKGRPRCRKMTPQEQAIAKKAAKKAAKTRASDKMGLEIANKKRLKTLKRKKEMGIS
jgi:hypothetical protein